MGKGKYILGFILIALAAINPLQLSIPWLVVFFLLGYDTLPFIGKIVMLALVLFGSSIPLIGGLIASLSVATILLFVLFGIDLLSNFIGIATLGIGRIIFIVIKLAILYFAAMAATGDAILALIILGADFLISMLNF